LTPFVWTGSDSVPRNASVVIREALVPMLLWPSVPVLRRIYEELTVVDRFVAEAAVALAPMRAEDVEEVTTIPRDAVVRIAGRLVGLGLLRAEGADYHPVEEAVRNALRQRAVPEERRGSMTFLYLPHSDDLIAFPVGPGLSRPPLLQKADPAEVAPLPRELAGARRADVLRARIQSGRAAGLPPEVVDVLDDPTDDALPPSCPAYRCRGHVKSGDDGRLVLEVLDRDGKKTAQWTLSGATGQAAQWIALASRAADAGAAWTADGGTVQVRQDEPAAWTYALDSGAAQAATRDGVRLGDPAGLEIHDGDRREDDRVVVVVNARFEPLDRRATRVFALDDAIHAVVDQDPAGVSADSVARATAAARARYGLAPDALTGAEVTESLWTGRHYRHVYGLRAAKDFPYDADEYDG
jgi:hypothetical protein